MNIYQRIKSFAAGVILIIYGILVMLVPESGYMILLLVLFLFLLFSGAKMLLYYFKMARFMVGGKSVLFEGVILLDAAIFTATLTTLKPFYLILYLVGAYAVAGVIAILRSFEEKKCESPAWKFKFASGLLNIVIAAVAVISGLFLKSADIPVYIYGGGMIYSGIMRIISGFRKTPSIYIQ